jgi:hypothetical protein
MLRAQMQRRFYDLRKCFRLRDARRMHACPIHASQKRRQLRAVHPHNAGHGVAPIFARRPVVNLGPGLHPWGIVRIQGAVTTSDLPGLCLSQVPVPCRSSSALSLSIPLSSAPRARRSRLSKSRPVEASECPGAGGGLGAASARSLHGHHQAA